jgi:hypothetical protein
MSQDAITAVKLRCNVACDLLQQYDGFFARLSLPRKDVTPNTIAEAHRFITKNANILVHQLKMSVTQKGHVALVHIRLTMLHALSMELLLVLMQRKISCLLLACFESLLVRLRKQPGLHLFGVPVR